MYEKITEIATFQILHTSSLDALIFGLDGNDKVAFNKGFELAGHESNHFITSIGTS